MRHTLVPHGDTAEYSAVDDHLVAQKVTCAEHRQQAFKRDSEIFRDAESAYATVRLVQHPRKRKRSETSGIYLGADVDGLAGFVSAPRQRIGFLCLLPLRLCVVAVVQQACCMSSLLSLWVHVLMFRRPAFSLLSECFKDACHVPRDSMFQLGRCALNELRSRCFLAPLASSRLACPVPALHFLYGCVAWRRRHMCG